MSDAPDSGAPAPPPPNGDCLTVLRNELARPLAAARLKLARRRRQSPPDPGVRGAQHAVTEAELMSETVVNLCCGIAEEPGRSTVDLGAMLAHTLTQLPRHGDSARIPLALPEPVVGQWNFWLCRRLLREVLAFAMAISDCPPLVGAFRASGAAVVKVHLKGADMSSPEAQTFRRELGPFPQQSHLWLASRLTELHGGALTVGSDTAGWAGLIATLPERSDPNTTRPSPIEVSEEQRRALIHMLRSPISAARLRLRFVEDDPIVSGTFADIERDLLTADSAVARLIPLTGGRAAAEPLPGDLVPVVSAAVRAQAPFATLTTVGGLEGNWDAFLVDCVVRNLMALSAGRTLEPTRFTLKEARAGAVLSMTAPARNPPAEGGHRWLIQQLADAHGGWSSFASRSGHLAAEVFLGGELT